MSDSFDLWLKDIGSKRLVAEMYIKRYRKEIKATKNPLRKIQLMIKIRDLEKIIGENNQRK